MTRGGDRAQRRLDGSCRRHHEPCLDRAASESTAHTAAALEAWRFAASAAPEPGEGAQAPAATLPRAQAEKKIRAELAALDAAREGRHVWIHSLRDLIRSDGKLPFALLEAMKQAEAQRSHARRSLPRAGVGRKSAIASSPSFGHRRRRVDADGQQARRSSPSAAWPSRRRRRSRPSGNCRGLPTRTAGAALAGTATLALGSLGNRLITAKDDRYPSLRSDLLDGALAGADARQRVDFVHALGNTGDVSLAREIVPLLRRRRAGGSRRHGPVAWKTGRRRGRRSVAGALEPGEGRRRPRCDCGGPGLVDVPHACRRGVAFGRRSAGSARRARDSPWRRSSARASRPTRRTGKSCRRCCGRNSPSGFGARLRKCSPQADRRPPPVARAP